MLWNVYLGYALIFKFMDIEKDIITLQLSI